MQRNKRRFIFKAFNITLSLIIFLTSLTIPTVASATDTSKRPIMSNLKAVPYTGVGIDGTTEYNGVLLTWDWVDYKPSWCEIVITDYDLGFDYSGTQYNPDIPEQRQHVRDIISNYKYPIVDRNSLAWNDPFTTQAFICENTTKFQSPYQDKVFENKRGQTYYFYILAYQAEAITGVPGGIWYIVDCIQYTRPQYLGVIPNGMNNDLKFSFANHQSTPPAGTLMGRIQRFDTEKALGGWAPSIIWRIYSNGDGTYYADKKIFNYNWSNGYPLGANGQELHSTADGTAAVLNPDDPRVYCTIDNSSESYCIMSDIDVYEHAASGERSYYRYLFISEAVHAEAMPTQSEYVDVGPQVSLDSVVTPTGNAPGQTGSVTFNVNKIPRDTTGRFHYYVNDFVSRYKWTVIHITSTDVNDCKQTFSTDANGYVNSGVHDGANECGSTYHPYSLITKTAVLGGYTEKLGDPNQPVYDAVTGAALVNSNGSIIFNGQDSANITFHFASLDPNSSLYQRQALNSKVGITQSEEGEVYNRNYMNNNILVPGKTYVFKFVSCYYFLAGEPHPQTGEPLTSNLNFFGTTEYAYTVPIIYNGVESYSTYTTDWVGVSNEPINVEITWQPMEFTFVKPNWDASTHTYPAGYWQPSSANNGIIKVKNLGVASITADFTFTKSGASDLTSIVNGVFKFQGDGYPIVNSINVRGGGWAKQVRLELQKVNNQEPQRNLNAETVGTVTVSINEMHSTITSQNQVRQQAGTTGPY